MNVLDNNDKCKGQITVFALLVFMLVASVLTAQYRSALFYAFRSDAALAANLSLDSFLATYQKPLREYYEILAVDGGYGQPVLAQDTIEEQLIRIFNSNLESSMVKNYMDEGVLAESPIFTYLIDGDWDFFVREISLGIQENMVIEGIDYIVEHWKKENNQAQNEYTYKRQVAENTEVENEEGTQDKAEEETSQIQDPRDLIMTIWNQGILKAACPSGFQVSEKTASMTDVSYPEASESVGMQIDLKNDSSIRNLFSNWESILEPQTYLNMLSEDLMVQNYIKDKFDSAVHGGKSVEDMEKVLQYEMEYIIGGHEKDSENLKTVLWKLLALRCVFNLSYLLTSTEKGNQVMVTATALSAAFMLPQFVEVFAFILKLSWAFAEALSDCRTLLKGGKIPLVKSNETWYLQWNDILQLYDGMLDGNQSKEGLDYEGYLQVLLAFTDNDTKYRRMTHLMEKNIRQIPGYAGFQMKNCIYGIQAVFGCNLGNFGYYEFQTALSY